MRPAAAEFLGLQAMGAPVFPSGCFQHRKGEGILFHSIPQAFAGQFVHNHCARIADRRMEVIAVEHLKAFRLPATPSSNVTHKLKRYTSETKIKVDEIGASAPIKISALEYYPTALPFCLRDGVYF